MEILIAIAVMMAATIAVHLALPQAVWSVAGKVCKCHKCLTFWTTLIALLLATKSSLIVAILLSMLMSYLSNWFGLLLMWLTHKYEELWEKLSNKRKM